MKVSRIVIILGISFSYLGLSVSGQGENSTNQITALLNRESRVVSFQSNQGDFQFPGSEVATPVPSIKDGSRIVVRAYYTDRQMVNKLTQRLVPWEIHPEAGYLVVDVNQHEYELLESLGFRLVIDQRLTNIINQPRVALPQQTSGIPGYPCYRTVEETFASAQALASTHPELVQWVDIGDSWEKTQPGGNPGYDMMVLHLTNSAIPGPKPKLFLMASVHAREYTPAELATRFAEYLVEYYNVDPDVTWILDYHEVHLLLQANPDGRKLAEAGIYWRKNTDENYCSSSPPDRGADLNRNFEFEWGCCGGSSGDECSPGYRGSSAASEPETQAIQNYVRSQFPDQRGPLQTDPAPDSATGVFLDLHSYNQLVYWPWGFTAQPSPNGAALQTLGRKLAYFNAYFPEQIGMPDFTPDGSGVDFAYGELGLAAYAFELGTWFFEDCDYFESTIIPENLHALIYAAKASRAPYRIPSGPDIISLAVLPTGVITGTSFQLTSTVDDTRYNNTNGAELTQTVAASEYYIDVPSWITTTTPISYPMTAADGSFDHETEDVIATVDASTLTPGRHIVFVRGQDEAGNWGPPKAIFIYVPNKNFLPLIVK